MKCLFTGIAQASAFAAPLILLAVPLGAQTPKIRDSAGVRIVENPARLTRIVNLRMAEKPVLDLGGLDDNPDNEFKSGQGYLRGVPLAAGGFAAIDVSRVQFFTAAGRRERITGRPGSGPADLRYVLTICRTRGDTLVLGDSQNHRMSVLDEHGAIVRTIPMGENGSPPFEACFDDGTFVLEKSLPAATGAPQLMRITRMRLDGSVANVIGEFSAIPFDFVTMSEVSVLAAGDRLYFGTGVASEVQVYSEAGKLLSLVRSNDRSTPISDAEAERRMASTIPTNASADERTARMERMRRLAHATSWPAYGRMHVDRQGRLWVEDYRLNYPSSDGWSAFDASGRLVGRLVIPAVPKGERQPEVVGFGDNNILVRHVDSDGAEHLTTYAVIGAGAG